MRSSIGSVRIITVFKILFKKIRYGTYSSGTVCDTVLQGNDDDDDDDACNVCIETCLCTYYGIMYVVNSELLLVKLKVSTL